MKLSSILVVEDCRGIRKILLNDYFYVIGRNPWICNIRLSSQLISKHHATLIQMSKEDETHYYRIVDGNPQGQPSDNGLLINGRRIMSHDLENGDEIVFGPQARAVYYQIERDITPPDEFGPDLSGPRNSRNPYPLTPHQGAEATPDNGQSTIP